jgi:hypothetical protein
MKEKSKLYNQQFDFVGIIDEILRVSYYEQQRYLSASLLERIRRAV